MVNSIQHLCLEGVKNLEEVIVDYSSDMTKIADRMARLRIYERNGGSMLELVRYQKEALPKASGCEDVIYSSKEMFLMERKNRKALGALADLPTYSIPYPQIKKIASLKNHIWGL